MEDCRPISELRNLGPATERELEAVGIRSLQDIIEIGVEETFQLVIASRRARGAKVDSSATLMYALYGAVHDIDWRDVPESQKLEFKKLAAELRERT